MNRDDPPGRGFLADPPPGPVVTVFGSSRVQPGDAGYEAALELGRLLGQRGWVLCNGGYNGTMEAGARGAKEAGGTTIGVTVSFYANGVANTWIDKQIVTPSLFARLEHLVGLGEAYVVLSGGIGTLLELSMVWNAVQATQPRKPVLVVGPVWAEVVQVLRTSLPMYPWESETLILVPSVRAAVEYLDGYFAERWRGEAAARGPGA